MTDEMLGFGLDEQIASIQYIILVVIRQRSIPPVEDLHFIRKGEIEFLLQVLIVGRQQALVVILIVRVVVRPLG